MRMVEAEEQGTVDEWPVEERGVDKDPGPAVDKFSQSISSVPTSQLSVRGRSELELCGQCRWTERGSGIGKQHRRSLESSSSVE
jgi:hypothetical protein